MPYTLLPGTIVNTTTDNRQSASDVAQLNDGGHVVVWSSAGQDGYGYGLYSQRFDAAGEPVGGETRVNTITDHSQIAPEVISLTSGGYVVIWETDVAGTTETRGVFSQQFDASGAPVGEETQVVDAAFDYRATPVDDGGYVIVWSSRGGDGPRQLFSQRFDADGEAVGEVSERAVGYAEPYASIAPFENGFIATWRESDGNEIVTAVQTFSPDGVALSPPVRISGSPYGRSDIVALSDGGYVVVWRTGVGSEIQFQILDADGTPTGDIQTIANAPGASGLLPAVAATIDGGFVVAWTHFQSGSPNSGVFAQAFHADGTPDGDRHTLYSSLVTGGEAPSITTSGSGSVTVTYSVYSGGTPYFEVYQARLETTESFIAGTPGDDRLTAGSTGDRLYGGAGDDRLIGGDGNDLLSGSLGGDILRGGAGDDDLRGGAGADELYGGSGDDTLNGGAGDDVLDGRSGADVMEGGAGNDIYHVDDRDDVVVETEDTGIDHVFSAVTFSAAATHVENITLTGNRATSATGNALDNILVGNNGANTLRGGDGDDLLEGGSGDDSLYGGRDDDFLRGAGGDDYLDGGDGDDTLLGGSGDDTLIGGLGGDVMEGRTDDDTYYVDDRDDVVIELAGQGIDHVFSEVTFSAASTHVEHITLTGNRAVSATGNALDNIIIGNNGANTLRGGDGDDVLEGGSGDDALFGGRDDDILRGAGGDDTLDGGDGNDTILGGSGNDTLRGGAGDDVLDGRTGADQMYGGDGVDRFVFSAVSDSPLSGYDRIFDLEADDIIDLGGIDADVNQNGDQDFTLVGSFTGQAGEMTMFVVPSGFTWLQMDVDGDGVADMRIALLGDHTDFDNFLGVGGG